MSQCSYCATRPAEFLCPDYNTYACGACADHIGVFAAPEVPTDVVIVQLARLPSAILLAELEVSQRVRDIIVQSDKFFSEFIAFRVKNPMVFVLDGIPKEEPDRGEMIIARKVALKRDDDTLFKILGREKMWKRWKTIVFEYLFLSLGYLEYYITRELKDFSYAMYWMLDKPWFDPGLHHNFALVWATRIGDSEMVAKLLADGRVVIPKEDDDRRWASLLADTMLTGNRDTFAVLLADGRFNPERLLPVAIRQGFLDFVDILLADKRVDPNATAQSRDEDSFGVIYTALEWAVARGYVDVVMRLLDDGRVIPSIGVLKLAIDHGKSDIVDLLLKDGRVILAEDDGRSIILAAKYGQMEIISMLLADDRVNPTVYISKAFYIAAEYGRANVVSMLLTDWRTYLSSADYDRALAKAVGKNRPKVVALLLNDGYVRNTLDEYRILELVELAANEGNSAVVRELQAVLRSQFRSAKQARLMNRIRQ